jgi:RimJ/RimL family protein N-acetyltransferase
MSPTLRPVDDSDLWLLFDWVNRPDSLANKLGTASAIEADHHKAWFRERRRDPHCMMWIVELEGKPVGQVRLTPGDGAHEVDIYVEAAYRRRGVALSALRAAASRYWARYPTGRLIARVLGHNCASHSLFAVAGYIQRTRSEGHAVLELSRPANHLHSSRAAK